MEDRSHSLLSGAARRLAGSSALLLVTASAAVSLSAVRLSAQEPAGSVPVTGDLVLQVYDVRDLVPPPPPAGPELVLRVQGEEEPEEPPAEPPAPPMRVALETPQPADAPAAPPRRPSAGQGDTAFVARLASQLSHFVQPPLRGAATISPVGGSHLTAIASPEQHRWIERTLQRHRGEPVTTLQLEARIYQMTTDAWLQAGLGDEPIPLNAKEWNALHEKLRDRDGKLGGVDLLVAPAVVCLPLRDVQVVTVSQTAYIADFTIHRLEVGGEEQVIADPVIKTVQDGVWLRGSMLLAGDDAIGFDFEFRHADLQQPIPTAEMRLEGIDTPFTIQRPTVEDLEVHARAIASPGSAVAFPSPKSEDSTNRVLLVLIPSRVTLPGSSTEDGKAAEAPPAAGTRRGSGR